MGIVRIVGGGFCALVCLVLWGASAEAEKIDWQRGLLIHTGAAVGDLRSPNREMARIKAERQALSKCKASLLAAAPRIAKAGGGDFAADEKWIANAMVSSLHTDFGTDGSVVVTMGFGLDQLRTAAFGPDRIILRKVIGKAEANVQPIVIDARGVGLLPAVGYQLSDGSQKYRGPTLFFRSEKAALAQVAWKKGTEIRIASSLVGDELRIPRNALQDKLESLPLVVILWKQQQ